MTRARSAETSRMELPFGDFFGGTSAAFATGAGSARSNNLRQRYCGLGLNIRFVSARTLSQAHISLKIDTGTFFNIT